MPRTRFNGVNLFWERAGATGEPLVLVHGSWVDHHGWDGVVPSLSRSFRVVTYDRRGHSRSERATSRYNIRAEVAPDWMPLVVTPPFPTCPSGHGGIGAAARRVLEELFGRKGHSITLTKASVASRTRTRLRLSGR